MSTRRTGILAALLLLAQLLPLGASGQQQPAQGDQARRLVVTFDGEMEDLPQLKPEEFQIELDKQKVAPKRLYDPAQLPTLIAVVLQENIRQDFGTQIPALRDFILAQPKNTYVGLFYLSVDSVDNPTNGFQSDLKMVADLLRTPKGQADLAPPTPYISVAKIGKYMDSLPAARKEMLLFSEGSDAIVPDASPGQNRNLRAALEQTRDAGIPVWVVYTDAFPPANRVALGAAESANNPRQVDTQTPGGTGGADPRAMNDASVGGRSTDAGAFAQRNDAFSDTPTRPRVSYSVANLKELADKSGGKLLSSKEQITDISPYLAELRQLMSQQYVLEYEGTPPIKKVKMNRKLKDVKFLAPER